MTFSFCKRCVKMTIWKIIPEFVVVNPTSGQILKSGFDSFESARAWSNNIERSNSRVQEKFGDKSICAICKGSH